MTARDILPWKSPAAGNGIMVWNYQTEHWNYQTEHWNYQTEQWNYQTERWNYQTEHWNYQSEHDKNECGEFTITSQIDTCDEARQDTYRTETNLHHNPVMCRQRCLVIAWTIRANHLQLLTNWNYKRTPEYKTTSPCPFDGNFKQVI